MIWGLKRARNLVFALVMVAIQLLFALPVTHVGAAADTCIWTGAVDANWSNGGNWNSCDNGGVPENGDALFFPDPIAINRTTNNDLVGLQLQLITIGGAGYTLGGNDFTITSNNSITTSHSATVSANVTYSTSSGAEFYPAAGATLTLSGTTTLDVTGLNETSIGSPASTGTVDFTGNIVGTSGAQFVVVDGATAIVRGAANTFTASQVGAESDAIFECRSATCFGNNANDIYMGGGRVHLHTFTVHNNDFVTSGVTPNESVLAAYESLSITGAGVINDPLRIEQNVAGESIQFTGTITLNGNISVSNLSAPNTEVRFDTTVTGTGGLDLLAGTTRLSNANTFQGVVNISNGAVAEVRNVDSLGANTAGTTVNAGGAIATIISGGGTINEPITLAGSGNSTIPAAIYGDSSSAVTWAGNLVMTDDALIMLEPNSDDYVISGTISGTGNLTLLGWYSDLDSDSFTIEGGSPNTYDGETIVSGGTVYFEKAGAIPNGLTVESDDPANNRSQVYFYNDSNVMDNASTLTMGNEEDIITFGANNEVIGGLTGDAGTVRVQTDGDRVIIDQNHNTTYGGVFYVDGSAATFEKRGTGTLTLTGDASFEFDIITFEVSEGTLVINGDVQTNTGGNVELNGGTLKGNGTVGAVTAAVGLLAPGNSPGILNVSSLTLAPGTTFEVEIDGPTAGTEYDQVVSSGAVDLGGATLSILPTFTPSNNQEFTIITGSSVTGTFDGIADGETITADGVTFRVNYNNDNVTLTYVSGTLVNTGLNTLTIVAFSLALVAVAVGLKPGAKLLPITNP